MGQPTGKCAPATTSTLTPMTISLVGFDADDTLWHSERHFASIEERFRDLVAPWVPEDEAAERLLERERANLELFGYGVKGFTLSMIETAIEASRGTIPTSAVQQLIEWGKEILAHPVELLPGVLEAIDRLSDHVRLALITKGDLFHQEAKIAASGLADRFDRIEILSEKSPDQYRRVLERCDAAPAEFMMVGNSLRSDVLPVVDIGGHGVLIPYQILWGHEKMDGDVIDAVWHQLDEIAQLPDLVNQLNR